MTNSVLVCGSMAFDTIAVFEGRFKEHILADRIHALSVSFLVPSMRKEYGGCSGNIAYSMRLLGGKPVPVATVGEDAGEYLERLQGLGIDVSRIKTIPETFTAQCFITTDLDDNQITAFHPGAMAFAAQNDVTGAKAAWAIVAPDAKEGMFAHAERLNKSGIPFIFDLGQAMPLFDRDDLERMLKMTQALTVNDYEASVVEQRTGRSIEDIARDLTAVVVTRGAEGATLYTEGKTVQIAPVRAPSGPHRLRRFAARRSALRPDLRLELGRQLPPGQCHGRPQDRLAGPAELCAVARRDRRGAACHLRHSSACLNPRTGWGTGAGGAGRNGRSRFTVLQAAPSPFSGWSMIKIRRRCPIEESK